MYLDLFQSSHSYFLIFLNIAGLIFIKHLFSLLPSFLAFTLLRCPPRLLSFPFRFLLSFYLTFSVCFILPQLIATISYFLRLTNFLFFPSFSLLPSLSLLSLLYRSRGIESVPWISQPKLLW